MNDGHGANLEVQVLQEVCCAVVLGGFKSAASIDVHAYGGCFTVAVLGQNTARSQVQQRQRVNLTPPRTHLRRDTDTVAQFGHLCCGCIQEVGGERCSGQAAHELGGQASGQHGRQCLLRSFTEGVGVDPRCFTQRCVESEYITINGLIT